MTRPTNRLKRMMEAGAREPIGVNLPDVKKNGTSFVTLKELIEIWAGSIENIDNIAEGMALEIYREMNRVDRIMRRPEKKMRNQSKTLKLKKLQQNHEQCVKEQMEKILQEQSERDVFRPSSDTFMPVKTMTLLSSL